MKWCLGNMEKVLFPLKKKQKHYHTKRETKLKIDASEVEDFCIDVNDVTVGKIQETRPEK